jgi:hypothetical protein
VCALSALNRTRLLDNHLAIHDHSVAVKCAEDLCVVRCGNQLEVLSLTRPGLASLAIPMAIPRIPRRWRLQTLMIVVGLFAMGLGAYHDSVKCGAVYLLLDTLLLPCCP